MLEHDIKKKRTAIKLEGNPSKSDIIICVSSELFERGVVPPMQPSKMKWKEMTYLPKMDKHKRLVEFKVLWDIEHWAKMTEIEPLPGKSDFF